MAPMAIGDIFSCIMVHGAPVKSLSYKSQSPVQSLMSIVIMQHTKAQFDGIPRGVLIGVSLHHWRCKCNVAHPALNINLSNCSRYFLAAFTSDLGNLRDLWFKPLMHEWNSQSQHRVFKLGFGHSGQWYLIKN